MCIKIILWTERKNFMCEAVKIKDKEPSLLSTVEANMS